MSCSPLGVSAYRTATGGPGSTVREKDDAETAARTYGKEIAELCGARAAA